MMSNLPVRLAKAFTVSLSLAGCVSDNGSASLTSPALSAAKSIGASSETSPDCMKTNTLKALVFAIGTTKFDSACAAYNAANGMIASGDPSLMVLGTNALARLNPIIEQEVKKYAKERNGGPAVEKRNTDCIVAKVSQDRRAATQNVVLKCDL